MKRGDTTMSEATSGSSTGALSAMEVLALDAERYYALICSGRHTPQNALRLWLTNAEFRCVMSYRLRQAAGELYRRNRMLGLLPLALAASWRRRVSSRRHVHLSAGARIGPGLYLMHAYGIMVGPSPIGANCIIHQNVTIGDRVAGGDNRVPRLGNNVWIGPGATITGDITIGDDVTISAGSVISKSVPDGCLVAGNPGRVIQMDYDNRSLMGWTVPASGRGGVPDEATAGGLA